MKKIESATNIQIKRFSKLLLKKHRDKEGLYIIAGKTNALESLNLLRENQIESVLVNETMVDYMLSNFKNLEDKLIETKEEILQKVSALDSKTEIIVVAKQNNHTETIAKKPIIYLDRIRDPGNLGTIIRTAVAAGYGLILDNCCDVYSPKVVRSAMSAIILANIAYAEDRILEKYKALGYRIFGGDMTGKNIFSISSKPKKELYILVIGNEADGISRQVSENCDEFVSIPIAEIESLNASVAAGILIFEFKNRIYC